MGVLYKLRCERCGVEFEHQAGTGLIVACVGCEDNGNDDAPFRCPCCNMRYDPQAEDFADKLSEIVLWD